MKRDNHHREKGNREGKQQKELWWLLWPLLMFLALFSLDCTSGSGKQEQVVEPKIEVGAAQESFIQEPDKYKHDSDLPDKEISIQEPISSEKLIDSGLELSNPEEPLSEQKEPFHEKLSESVKETIRESIKEGSSSSSSWARRAGSSGQDEVQGFGVAIDTKGNVYVTGYFEGTANFGTTKLTSKEGWGSYVAKLDSNGNWLWAKRAGSSEKGGDLSVDTRGNVYVTGYFEGTADFGTTKLTSKGSSDIFVAKLDNSGKWLWAIRAGSSGQDGGRRIALDIQGNIIISGYFGKAADFGTIKLVSGGIFVAKMSSSGKWLWVKRTGGDAIAVDAQGNIIITGFFGETTNFGATKLTSKGGFDIFVAKLDSSGKWLWAKRAGSPDYSGPGDDRGNGVAVDGQGNIILTGYFVSLGPSNGAADFGTTKLYSKGGKDIFVAKLDSKGKWLWATRAGSGFGIEQGNGVAVDAKGNSYVTGNFRGVIYWADFGTIRLKSKGGSKNIFVAKLDSKGRWLWVKRAGSGQKDNGSGIGVNGQGNIAITGWFKGTADFGVTKLTSKGELDIFVWKLGNNP